MIRLKEKDNQITEAGFEKYVKLLNDRAWSFHRSTGIDFEELQAVSFLSFCSAVQKYNFNRASLSTFLYHKINTDLIIYVKEERKHIYAESLWRENGDGEEVELAIPIFLNESIDISINLQQLSKQLSAEAQGVLEIIFSCPDELCTLVKSSVPRGIKSALYRYLEKLGWQYKKIKMTMDEIASVMFL